MKIALITAFNEKYAPIADVTLPLMKAYADQHGYGLHVSKYHEDPAQLESYGDRGKISLYLRLWEDHDVLMWLDIDVLILNHDICIERVLGPRPFLWSYDPNGPTSAFWIARCIPEVTLMFNYIKSEGQLGRRVIAREVPNPRRVTVQFEPWGSSDQMMMRDSMHLPPFNRTLGHCVSGKEAGHCMDYRIMNWPLYYDYIGDYEPGDWQYTLPSLPLERRRFALMKKAFEVFHDRLELPGWSGGDAEPAAGEPAAADA